MNLYGYVLQKRGTSTRAFLLEGENYTAPEGWTVLTRIGRGRAAVTTAFVPQVCHTTDVMAVDLLNHVTDEE